MSLSQTLGHARGTLLGLLLGAPANAHAFAVRNRPFFGQAKCFSVYRVMQRWVVFYWPYPPEEALRRRLHPRFDAEGHGETLTSCAAIRIPDSLLAEAQALPYDTFLPL